MNRSSVFRNKLIYVTILIAMLIPLYLLGQPAGGSAGDAGGQLTQMRTKFNIAESELGDINPASETMKLASLGLRGVAATLLWSKANDYKVHHEWDRLKATLNNIALLQPHYEKVWEFQAHNLSYNVSSEFDDYRQRYAMVREGIEFLTRGVEQNRKAPRLIWYTGWFYGQKIGMSDEKKQFRRLFSDDEPQHEALRERSIAVDSPESRGPDGKPDNWLIGRQWLLYGYDLVDSGVRIRNQTPLNFYSTGPKWRIKHAEAIESEGVLDDRAKSAWQLASDDWQTFGQRSVPTTSPFTIKLGSLDEMREQRETLLEQFMELAGETYQEEERSLLESLSEEERLAWETPTEERSGEQQNLAYALIRRLEPSLGRVARKAPEAVRLRAIQLAAELEDLKERIAKTDSYREQVNWEYWLTLTSAEQEDRTVEARRLLFEAEQANADSDLDLAIEKYEESFELWAQVFDDYPVLLQDDLSEDLMRSVRRYKIANDRDTFADDFPLAPFVEVMETETKSGEEYKRLRDLQRQRAEKPLPATEDTPAPTPATEPSPAEEPAAAEKSAADPDSAPDPTPEPAAEPAAESTPESEAKPAAEPEAESTPEPAADASPEPAGDAESQPE
ncbi:MAG: IRE (iron responsive element) [Planctomycetaceae bacterium]|nr:MAG: IRE (iron responsive element) [Planctomycetaceae bacterium]